MKLTEEVLREVRDEADRQASGALDNRLYRDYVRLGDAAHCILLQTTRNQTASILKKAWAVIRTAYGGHWQVASETWRHRAQQWRADYCDYMGPAEDDED